MKKIVTTVLCSLLLTTACSKEEFKSNYNYKGNHNPVSADNLPEQNLLRAMQLTDAAVENYFEGNNMTLAEKYNPYTDAREGTGSVWVYTSCIEAVNAVIDGLKTLRDQGDATLYDQHYSRYAELLDKLYLNAGFYRGTFTLTSYTQTREWTVYAVNRSSGDMGTADVSGIMNVYDDQMWLIRELLNAYRLTGDEKFLTEAEYLTGYVLDGWDSTLDDNGVEYGGITWGPGYSTKHSCSNGPIVSPLVWLHEIYKDRNDEITYLYIDTDRSRKTKTVRKSDYYLDFAERVYAWQKNHLRRDDGVYADMMHNPGTPLNPGDKDLGEGVQLELIDGVYYRKHANMAGYTGEAYSYNSGTMISGAADLYRATQQQVYLDDLKELSDDTFAYFAKKDATVAGYYTYAFTGNNNWFNGVLMRGWADAYACYPEKTAEYLDTFQKNLDYAYDNFLYDSMLPVNLLVGWSRDQGHNAVAALFTFAYAAEYAVLATYEAEK